MAVQRTGPALPSIGGSRPSYRASVADALRAALVAGELRPGEVYSAPSLAARFGVSATSGAVGIANRPVLGMYASRNPNGRTCS